MACSNCNSYTIPGISKVYYTILDGDQFDYLQTGSTIILDDQYVFSRIICTDLQSVFTETKVQDSRGTYYKHQVELAFSYFNNDDPFELAEGQQLVIIFKDQNSNWLIGGYSTPFLVDKLESNTNENAVTATLIADTYQRLKPVLEECWFDNECCSELAFSFITTPADTPEIFNGTITVSVSGGTGSSYLYKLDKSRTTYQSETYFDGLSAGTYTVIVRDLCILGDCTDSQEVTVPVDPFFTIETELSANFSPLQWRVDGSNGASYTLSESVTADTQTMPLFSPTLIVTAKKQNNSGLAQGDGTVLFKKNGTTLSTVPFSVGDNIGSGGTPPHYTFSGLTDGNILRVEMLEQSSDVIVTIGNFGTGMFINDVRFNGVSISVTSGSFPMAQGDILVGTTNQVGTVSASTDVSFAGHPTFNITFNPSSGMSQCQSFTNLGTYTFITTQVLGDSCSIGVGDGSC